MIHTASKEVVQRGQVTVVRYIYTRSFLAFIIEEKSKVCMEIPEIHLMMAWRILQGSNSHV